MMPIEWACGIAQDIAIALNLLVAFVCYIIILIDHSPIGQTWKQTFERKLVQRSIIYTTHNGGTM